MQQLAESHMADPVANTVDEHIGSRIRLRRTLLGLTQERVGEAIGLTFQQIQKYERGLTRVGASRLFDLARVLDVPIGFFFDDLPASLRAGASSYRQAAGGSPDSLETSSEDLIEPREKMELLRIYGRISDREVRKRVIELMKCLST